MASKDISCSIYGHGVLCSYAIRTGFLSNFQDTGAAICFLRLLSDKLQYSFESVPKDDTSKVFHAGGYGGVSYLAKCSIKKSSFERFNSSSILERHLEKIVVLENNDSLANQNAP